MFCVRKCYATVSVSSVCLYSPLCSYFLTPVYILFTARLYSQLCAFLPLHSYHHIPPTTPLPLHSSHHTSPTTLLPPHLSHYTPPTTPLPLHSSHYTPPTTLLPPHLSHYTPLTTLLSLILARLLSQHHGHGGREGVRLKCYHGFLM